MEKKPSIFTNVIFNLIILSLCFVSTYVAFSGNVATYKSLWMLPLGFAIIYMLSHFILTDKAFGNIGYVLFWGQSVVKCVIAPLVLCIGNYESLFANLNSVYIYRAILLMLYEQLICTFVIAFVSRRKTRIKITLLPDEIKLPKLTLGTFVTFFVLLIAAIWILEPGIKNNFVTIFDMFSSGEMFTGFDYVSLNEVGSSGRVLTTLFLVLFKSFRIILPFYIIKVLKSKWNTIGSFITSIFVVALQFLFISETVAMSLVVAFILLSYMMRIYPEYKKAIIGLMITSSAFVVFVLSLNYEFMAKWFNVGGIDEYASLVLQSYVPGVCNVASIFRADRLNGASVLYDTVISTIPFQSSIFGSVNWSNDLNSIYTSLSGLNAQICSTIGGGWFMFGSFAAPLFSAIFTYVSMNNGYKYYETDDEVKKLLYLYMCVQSMLGIGVYNIQITITVWIQVGLVLYMATKLSKS